MKGTEKRVQLLTVASGAIQRARAFQFGVVPFAGRLPAPVCRMASTLPLSLPWGVALNQPTRLSGLLVSA